MNTQKPNVYQEVPEFDQATQYIVQGEPEEREDCIFYPCVVLDLPEPNEPKTPFRMM